MAYFLKCLIVDFEDSIPSFLSDPSQLQQVFLNLMNIDDLVMKLEKAWEKKEFAGKGGENKIRKIVESPSIVFDLFPKRK